ncbi:MAG: beta-ketoacyl synthase N-terminal-like domain-containing protein [Holophaga sp.]|nr:beta-ketoacyl synthase N-terminal-like domain-containing protein [Holophaga sp.]
MALAKPVFLAAGAYTVSLGPGRAEFSPRTARPGLTHYIQEAGRATLAQIGDPGLIDEGVIGNFMAARFNRQGHLGSLMTIVHPTLEYKPAMRVEGACASGGLALASGVRSVLSGLAEVVLVMGVEVQNTVKALYGADYLAGAGYYEGERKAGPAFFFPGRFSDRAGAYAARIGPALAREAMARWFQIAVENARLNPEAQEYHNRVPDLLAQGRIPPKPDSFVEHLNLADCSKVSDGAAAILVASAEGLRRLGLARRDAVEVAGLGVAAANLTAPPPDLTELTTCRVATARARDMAGIRPEDAGIFEVHDCFTISGLLSVEALGLAPAGGGAGLVLAGATERGGRFPTNTGGGLMGYGHPTGASGVRMAVDLWRQFTGRAGAYQVPLAREHGILVSMGGDDKTVVSLVLKA